MTDRVNGSVHAGEFLTGSMDFFSFATTVPVGQTNVTTEVVDLPGYQSYQTFGTWVNVTVTDAFGTATTYSTLNSYLDAFYQQKNLDVLVGLVATRANPVAVNVKTFPGTVNGSAVTPSTSTIFADMGLTNGVATPTSHFGTYYNSTSNVVYVVTLATEKSLLWAAGTNGNFTGTAADNTNTNGYNILSSNSLYGGLDGLVAYDTQSTQVIDGSTNTFTGYATNFYTLKNTVAPYVGTWSTSSATTCNVLASQNFYVAGSLLA